MHTGMSVVSFVVKKWKQSDHGYALFPPVCLRARGQSGFDLDPEGLGVCGRVSERTVKDGG